MRFFPVPIFTVLLPPSTIAISPTPPMASQNSSTAPAFLVPAASSGSEYGVEPVLSLPLLHRWQPADPSHSQVVRDLSTIEEIIQCISDTRQDAHNREFAGQLILGFQWQASKVEELFDQLDARLAKHDKPKICRFEYDYKSETVYLNIMGESTLHSKVQNGLRDYIKNQILKWRAIANDARIRDLFRSIDEPGTADIKYESKIRKQPDGSFGQAGTLPSLVFEVS